VALDDATPDERAARLRQLVTPGSTWWLDTGRDRPAGARGHDPGDDRPWPLHGTMTMEAKLEIVSRAAPTAFPQGLGRRVVSRVFGTDDAALVEAEGDALHVSGKRYRNRYALVIDVDEGGITSVREYLDTLHAEDVFGGDRLSRPVAAPMPAAVQPLVPASRAEDLALALWEPLASADVDGFGALFAAGGTWWTDSGTDRDAGSFDRVNGAPGTWPLHGVVPIDAKLDAMRARLASGYTGATLRVTPVRMFSEGDLVALEAEGYAELSNGRIYQNRYAFVIEAGDGGIHQVREYCDTLHVIDATGAVAPTA
jgi:ketosteroid isomerase-like protein